MGFIKERRPLLATHAFDAGPGGLTDTLSNLGVAKPLPRIAMIGDSRFALGLRTDGPYGYSDVGWMTWLRRLSKQSFDFDITDVYATGGWTSSQIITDWLPSAAASSASVIAILATTNDRSNSFTLAQSIANMTQIISTLTGVGKRVLLVSEMPRGNATFQAPQRLASPQLDYHIAMHRWFQQQASVPGVIVVDVWSSLLLDPTSSTVADFDPAKTDDGLHPNAIGAYLMATKALAAIQQILPPIDLLPASNLDVITASNPRGSVSPNPMVSGTGGTLVQTTGTLTGPIASNWRVESQNFGGLTATLSQPTINGQLWQQAVITGTPTGPAVLNFRHFGMTVNTGDVIEAVAAIQIDAGQTGVRAATIQWQDGTGTIYIDGGFVAQIVGAAQYPNVALDMIFKTPARPTTGTALNDALNFLFTQGTVVSATVRFRAASVRKVIPITQ